MDRIQRLVWPTMRESRSSTLRSGDLCGLEYPDWSNTAPHHNRQRRWSTPVNSDCVVAVRDTPGGPMAVLSRRYDLTIFLRTSGIAFNAGGWRRSSTVLAPDCAQVPIRFLSRIVSPPYVPDGTPTILPPTTFGYNFGDYPPGRPYRLGHHHSK